jgi:hypothetical protein
MPDDSKEVLERLRAHREGLAAEARQAAKDRHTSQESVQRDASDFAPELEQARQAEEHQAWSPTAREVTERKEGKERGSEDEVPHRPDPQHNATVQNFERNQADYERVQRERVAEQERSEKRATHQSEQSQESDRDRQREVTDRGLEKRDKDQAQEARYEAMRDWVIDKRKADRERDGGDRER